MRSYFVILALLVLFAPGCGGSDYTPKPRAYFRIKFPEKRYQKYSGGCPFTFQYPVYSAIELDSSSGAKPCWINLNYAGFNGKVHLSYQPVTSKKVFADLVEDARTFAFKHTVKATAIDEGRIAYPDRKVYGIYYKIDGNTASSIQFFLTDSVNNYLRGALYFNEEPRLDSIQPVLDFIKKDIDIFIQSFRWIKP